MVRVHLSPPKILGSKATENFYLLPLHSSLFTQNAPENFEVISNSEKLKSESYIGFLSKPQAFRIADGALCRKRLLKKSAWCDIDKLSIKSKLYKKGDEAMKCYVLEQGQKFAADMEKAEISAELERDILSLCLVWQARDLHQEGQNTDDYESCTLYDALDAENFVVSTVAI